MAKKVSDKNVDGEHAELEQAMQELSRQTDALLAENKPKAKTEKPVMPKKKVVPHTKGRSLDIVNHAPSAPKKPVQKPEHELLAEYAGLSFNEKPASQTPPEVAKVSVKPTIQVSKPAVVSNKQDTDGADELPEASIIHSHEGKRLDPIKTDEPDDNTKEDVKKTGPSVKDAKNTNEETEASVEDAKPDEKDDKAANKQTKQPANEKIHFSEPEKSEPKDEEAIKADEPEEGEDEVKKPDPEKPTVFDTNEYHSELHDWSKLARPRRWPAIVALFALLIAGLAGYLIMTDSLPLL